jgi:hypothetical protein
MNLDQKCWACYLFANIHWVSDHAGAAAVTAAWFGVGMLLVIADAVISTTNRK